jgi:DMSO/TMAO reductase YedYZ heme-binding membrane subunit
MRHAPVRHVPARHQAGWRHDARSRHAPGALRRFWPAGLAPAAIAVCTLAAIALAGFIVIATSLVVVATGRGGATVSASVAQALEACSGELALFALTVAVVLGVAATERHFLPPGTRVTAQIAHRAVALTAVGFLLVHILLETVSARAALLAAVLPFTDARGRLYLGLGTIASDLVIAITATSLARMRYARSRHPQLWRAVHRSIYVAWPLAILHGMLMRGGPVWAAWTYGICAALVAVALTARIRLQDPRSPTESSPPAFSSPPASLPAFSSPPWAPARGLQTRMSPNKRAAR